MYTKGTWEQSASIIHCENGVICQLSEPRKTKYVEYHPLDISSPDWQEAMDNGKLIKAAPLMLEALEAIQEAFAKGEIKFTKVRQADSDPYHPANVLLSAALAAARGDER